MGKFFVFLVEKGGVGGGIIVKDVLGNFIFVF